MNKLYTFPACNSCRDAKDYLTEKGVEYTEVNIGSGAGRKEFNEFYKERRDEIARDETGIVLPIFIQDTKITQGLEKILELEC